MVVSQGSKPGAMKVGHVPSIRATPARFGKKCHVRWRLVFFPTPCEPCNAYLSLIPWATLSLTQIDKDVAVLLIIPRRRKREVVVFFKLIHTHTSFFSSIIFCLLFIDFKVSVMLRFVLGGEGLQFPFDLRLFKMDNDTRCGAV